MSSKIPTYIDRIEQRPIPDIGRHTPNLDVDAYARNGNAGLLVRGGSDLIRLGSGLSNLAIERKEREIATDLLADKVSYEDAMRQFESDYMATKKGVDARTAEQDFDEFHKKQHEALQLKWQDNAYALKGVASMYSSMRSSSMNRAVSYRDNEDKIYKDSVLKASKEQAISVFSNPYSSYEEKQKAFRDEEINLRVLAGQRHIKTSGSLPKLSKEIDELANKTSTENNIDPALIKAVIATESNGVQNAVSKAGAIGLMQLMPDTAQELGVDPNDAKQNVQGGTRYLKQLLEKYEGNQELALMAYNWGMGNVDAYIHTGKGINGQQMPDETKRYVASVFDYMGSQTTGENAYAWVGGRNVQNELSNLKQTMHLEHVESLISLNKLGEAKDYIYTHSGEFGDKSNNIKMMVDARIDAAERKLEIETRREQEKNYHKLLTNSISSIQETVKDFPTLEEQKLYALSLSSKIEDPSLRKDVNKMLEEDFKIKQNLQNAQDMLLIKEYKENVTANNLFPSQAILGIDNIEGLSEKGKEALATYLSKEGQKETSANLIALTELRRRIDKGDIADDMAIHAFAFENGLTDNQIKNGLKYLEDGGNKAKVTLSRVEGIYKRMTKSKKLPEGLYEEVLQSLEAGKFATDENISKILSTMMMSGETKGSGLYLGYGGDETFFTAKQNAREGNWLPDLSKTEREDISLIFRQEGIKITEERLRIYKKEVQMGIPHGDKI